MAGRKLNEGEEAYFEIYPDTDSILPVLELFYCSVYTC